MSGVVRKAKKLVKSVAKPVKKIIKSPIGQIALFAALGPAAGIGGTAAGTSFLTNAARRAALNAVIQKASGQDVDLKSAIISGGVGAGIGQFAPTYLPQTITENPLFMDAATGALTNLATSAATGQKIDPRAALLAGALSAGAGAAERGFLESRDGQPLFGPKTTSETMPETGAGLGATDVYDEFEPQPTFREAMKETNLQRGISSLPAAQQVGQPINEFEDPTVLQKMSQQAAKDAIASTDDAALLTKPPQPSTTKITTGEAFKTFMQDKSAGNALNVIKTAAMNNKALTALTLTSLVTAASVPQMEDESDEEYAARLADVEKFTRQYGANLQLPQSQINRILGNVRAGSASEVRLGAMDGGIMNIPVRENEAGIKELDYRQNGGFVPVGVKEKADDVPAMLSKNEFVMTADAVRGAGNGDIEKGAQKMYDTMKQLESRVV